MKTSHVDAMAEDLAAAYAGAHANKGKTFRQRLADADRKREQVLQGLRDGLGKCAISKKYGIHTSCVLASYRVLARDGKICWDEEKGNGGGWRARNE